MARSTERSKYRKGRTNAYPNLGSKFRKKMRKMKIISRKSVIEFPTIPVLIISSVIDETSVSCIATVYRLAKPILSFWSRSKYNQLLLFDTNEDRIMLARIMDDHLKTASKSNVPAKKAMPSLAVGWVFWSRFRFALNCCFAIRVLSSFW